MDLSKILPATLADVGQRPNVKPEPRKRVKGRKDRAEAKVKKSVRAQCVDRDGYCIFGLSHWPIVGTCGGSSEWAHAHSARRSQTRGQAPWRRHNTAASFMACQRHHQHYDAHRFVVLFLTPLGADGAWLIEKVA